MAYPLDHAFDRNCTPLALGHTPRHVTRGSCASYYQWSLPERSSDLEDKDSERHYLNHQPLVALSFGFVRPEIFFHDIPESFVLIISRFWRYLVFFCSGFARVILLPVRFVPFAPREILVKEHERFPSACVISAVVVFGNFRVFR